MSTVTFVLAYLFFGVALPVASLELLMWLAPKTPGYRRRVMGVAHERR